MYMKYVTFCRWFAVLVLLQTFMPPGAESKPMPGKKTNMALSALAGMTAGHLIGRAVAAHREKKEKLDMSEHLPPNCRKEIRTERDKQDWNKFIETKYIVCDPLPYQQPQQTQQHQMLIVQPSVVGPAQPVAPAVQQVQPASVPQPNQQQPAGFQQSVVAGQPIGFVQPPQQATQPPAQEPQTVQVVQQPPQVEPSQPVQPVQTVQINVPQPNQQPPAGFQQSVEAGQPIGFVQPPQQAAQPPAQAPQIGQVVQQPQQVQPPQPVQPVQTVQIPQTVQTGPQPMQPVQVFQQAQPAQPAQGPSQVFVLSKKTGYFRKSSAEKILQTNFVLMMIMAFLLIWFQ